MPKLLEASLHPPPGYYSNKVKLHKFLLSSIVSHGAKQSRDLNQQFAIIQLEDEDLFSKINYCCSKYKFFCYLSNRFSEKKQTKQTKTTNKPNNKQTSFRVIVRCTEKP